MIKNTRIDLSKESEDRIDAINSIKYTLLLKYKVPACTDDACLVSRVMENCYECCRGLMEDYNNPSYAYYFFGQSSTSDEKSILGSLEHGTKKEKEGEIKFHDLILQHCIMSSYHAILTDLLDNKEVTSYEIISRIKAMEKVSDKKASKGLCYLVRNQKYLLEENKFAEKVRQLLTNEKKSSTASDFMRITETHRNILKYHGVFGKAEERIPLQFSDLWCRICCVPAANWKLNGDCKNKLKIIEKLDEELLKREGVKSKENNNKDSEIRIRGFHGNRVDGLYTHYLTERMFNFHMIYNMLKYVEYIDTNTKYTLSNDETLEILLLGKKMPNAFSRHCFWGYAVEKIIGTPNSSNDYWLHRDIYHSEARMLSTRRMETGFQISIWLNQYKLFINYMSEFVIPIYEWCFMGMLLEFIEAKYPEENHRKQLIRLLDLLSEYMEEHAEKIICPIKFHNQENDSKLFSVEMSSVLMKRQYEKFGQLSEKTIETLLHNLINSKDDVELNLKKINPDFFRKDREKQVEYKTYPNTNFSRIQMFYTDLIRYTHLQ